LKKTPLISLCLICIMLGITIGFTLTLGKSSAFHSLPFGASTHDSAAQGDTIWFNDTGYNSSMGFEQPNLDNATENVTQRVLIEYGDYAIQQGMYVPAGMPSIFLARIILEYADASFLANLQRPETLNATVTPRIVIEYADYASSMSLPPYSGPDPMPAILILSPQNMTYSSTNIPLTFVVDQTTSWIGYSLDEHSNVTVSGNTTLTSIAYGSHHVTVFANNTLGMMGVSNTVFFSVQNVPPAPTIIVQSPTNRAYDMSGIPLIFTVDQPTSWIGYSLDSQANVTVMGNTTMNYCLGGSHYVCVYANDTAGNMGASNIVQFSVARPGIQTCNSIGIAEDIINASDAVYLMGNGYSQSTTYNVYVVNHTTWTEGMLIPQRVAGTATTVTSDSSGNISAELVWNPPLKIGNYDVVVDVNGDGYYNSTIDALDQGVIGVKPGFQVVPEFPSIIILALFMIATLLAVTAYKRKRVG